LRTAQVKEGMQTLSIYPNPTEDLVFVKIISPVNTVGEMRIVDLNGREIRVQQVQNTLQPQALDLTELATGKYYLQWLVNNQLLDSQPFEKLK
jgi:Secretion system C-terminal sorting domain